MATTSAILGGDAGLNALVSFGFLAVLSWKKIRVGNPASFPPRFGRRSDARPAAGSAATATITRSTVVTGTISR